MIVVINPSGKSGHSFKGLHAYCSHDQRDKDKPIQTTERVDWISTRNVAVEDPNQAWKVMASTAYAQNDLKRANDIRTGKAPKDGAVMHVVMSFDSDEPSSPEAMQAAADELLASIGADPAKMKAKNKPKRRQFADEHQVIMYAHSDTDYPHLHLMINRIHPQTGVVLPTNSEQLKAQKWALKYSKEHGSADATPAREQNAKWREEGKRFDGQKRKTRKAYELDKQRQEVSNDNSRLKSVLQQQKSKDAELAQRGRDLELQKSKDLEQLIADHKKRVLNLDKNLQTHINKSTVTASELYRPKFRKLKEEQVAEMTTFEALEKTFFGRAANSWKVAKATIEDIGGHRRGFNLKTFGSAVTAGARKEYMEQAQKRAERALELEQERKVSEAKERLKTAHTARMEENRLRLEEDRAELKKRHLEEQERLKAEWRMRNEERENAIRALPAPVQQKTDAKTKAQLILASKDHRAEFDKARQKPAPEQDNTNRTDEDSGDEGKSVMPSPAPKPKPVKHSFDDAQKEKLEIQRKEEEERQRQKEADRLAAEQAAREKEDAEKADSEKQQSAREAYIAEQQNSTPEPPQDRESYISEQQSNANEPPSDREAYVREQQQDSPPTQDEPDRDPNR